MTRPRTHSGTAALAAALIAGASLAAVSIGAVAPASAACAPSVTVVKAKGTAAKAHVKASKPAVRKVGKRYVATATLAATAGRGSATVRQTICPNGASAAAASTTQTAKAPGTLTRTVKGKAATRKKAVKALKKAERSARTKLATKAKKKSKQRSRAAAVTAARAKAHHALYDSSVFYLTPRGNATVIVTTPPVGSPTLRAAANGDLVITYPVTSVESVPCFTRAKAWPSAFIFDGGTTISPAWAAASRTSDDGHLIQAPPLAGVPNSMTYGNPWITAWSGGTHGPSQHNEGVVTESSSVPPKPFAGTAVCFLPFDDQPPAGTVTLRGAHVGTKTPPTGSNLFKVAGGVPVTLG